MLGQIRVDIGETTFKKLKYYDLATFLLIGLSLACQHRNEFRGGVILVMSLSKTNVAPMHLSLEMLLGLAY